MPFTPISSMMTLVIPLFFTLAVSVAPPVSAAPQMGAGGADSVRRTCTGSFCELVRPAPRYAPIPPTSLPRWLPATGSVGGEAKPLVLLQGAAEDYASNSGSALLRGFADSRGGVVHDHGGPPLLSVEYGSRAGTTEEQDGPEHSAQRLPFDFGPAAPSNSVPNSQVHPRFCEYLGPATYYLSPSDAAACGFIEPVPLSPPRSAG